MTRAFDEQLELNFDGEQKPDQQAPSASSAKVSASVICFASHLRSRRDLDEEAEDAKLLERITSRVQHFK